MSVATALQNNFWFYMVYCFGCMRNHRHCFDAQLKSLVFWHVVGGLLNTYVIKSPKICVWFCWTYQFEVNAICPNISFFKILSHRRYLAGHWLCYLNTPPCHVKVFVRIFQVCWCAHVILQRFSHENLLLTWNIQFYPWGAFLCVQSHISDLGQILVKLINFLLVL